MKFMQILASMKSPKNYLLILALILFGPFSFSQQFTDLHGDYFGQPPPGKKAVKFAPDIIQLPDSYVEIVTFTPDGSECYFTCCIGNSHKIYYTKPFGCIHEVCFELYDHWNCP